ncbi:MAG: hypothetical protein AAGC64_09090 [Bacteroidota bacterium]
MFWIVQKDNPKPETYIPVFACQKFDTDRFENTEKFKVFKSKTSAVTYAKKLLSRFEVLSIRLFYEEGHSENLKNTRKK